MDTELEKKKQFLEMYWESKQRIMRLAGQIQELRKLKEIEKQQNNMILEEKTQDNKEIDEMIDELNEVISRSRCIYKKIVEQIEKLDDQNEANVLHFRFIKGLKWKEISKEMSYSERGLIKLRDRALKKIEIPENVQLRS